MITFCFRDILWALGFSAAIAFPHLASAQGVFDLGPLGGAAQQLGQDISGPAPTEATPASQLKFTVSPEMRARNQTRFIESIRSLNTVSADELAGHDLIGMLGEEIAQYGLHTDDLSDAYTVFLLINHAIVNQDDSEITQQQVDGTLQMVRSAMEQVPDLTDASNSDKQSITDVLLLQAFLNQVMYDSVKEVQPAGLPKIIEDVRAGSQAMDINIDGLEMTPDGLVARK